MEEKLDNEDAGADPKADNAPPKKKRISEMLSMPEGEYVECEFPRSKEIMHGINFEEGLDDACEPASNTGSNGQSKRKTFFALPRHKRSEMFIIERNKIRREFQRSGRLFTTHDYIAPEARDTWADFTFLSRIDKIAYGATISTCQDRMVEDAETLISDQTMDLFHKFGLGKLNWVLDKRDAFGKPILFRLEDNGYSAPREELDGLSFHKYQEKLLNEYLQEKKPAVYEQYEIQLYPNIVWVDMTVDEETITAEIINRHIRHFWEIGEKAWKADKPVDPSRLIYSTDRNSPQAHDFNRG